MLARGIFFDLDGTLADTLDANVRAYQEAITSINRKVTRKMLTDAFGKRVDVFMREFFADISEEEIAQVAHYKAKVYPKYLKLVKPNHTLINLIDSIKRKDHTVALVTTAKRKNAEAVLKSLGLVKFFDFIVAGEDVDKPKPDPESYLLALKISGLRPCEVLAYEDSNTGIAAATAAKILVIKVRIKP